MYTRYVLAIYDWALLGLNCRFIWKCPSHHMLSLYNNYVTANHLDIGVGTGYFMHHCRFPSSNPRLALMDLNPNSLDAAQRRLARYYPETYLRNALEPFNIDAPPFDSIGITNLLHCLPGDMKTKEVVLKNAKSMLNPGGVLFGSTILYSVAKPNMMASVALKSVNKRGIMSNMNDDVEVLRNNLGIHFSESSVRQIGYVALFHAKK